jgi:metallophosphoesterase (TIGR00282 family)
VLQSKPNGASRLLFVGDVYGEPGLKAVEALLPGLLRELAADICVVNGENAENGKGVSSSAWRRLRESGADVVTGGNHSLYREKFHTLFAEEKYLLRPHNLPSDTPGSGVCVFECDVKTRWAVVNLIGRALLPPSDDPYRMALSLCESLREETPLILLDYHAEASAEKIAMARLLDGKATAVIGTHTHVQTADEEIFAGGTAYLTDAGMTGPHSGVIGMDTDSALYRFLHPMSGSKSGVASGNVRFHAVVIDADRATGRALQIQRLRRDLP